MQDKRLKLKKNLGAAGSMLPLIIAFSAALFIMFGGLTNFLLVQQRAGLQEARREQAFQVAEAGLEYYRWRLAHAGTDYLTTTQIEQDLRDPQGEVIGHYLLDITPPDQCGAPVTVTSTGWHIAEPQVKRRLRAKLGQPSLAQYAFLVNSGIWFGAASNTLGPIHANGGVRMDGAQNALATSALATYLCGAETGCNPVQEKPGIWGAGLGGSQGLWRFPVPPVDFNALSLDLAAMKTLAQGAGTYYGPSGMFGYLISLKQNDTYEVRKVKKLYSAVWGWDGSQWVSHADQIKQTELVGIFPLPPDQCDETHLLFFEDSKVWVEGVTRAKLTIVAARFPDTPETNATIVINSDIQHPNPKDSQIALIAQKDVRLPLASSNNLEIDAVIIAQKGRFIRYYYDSAYAPNHLRNSLVVLGTIVSNTPPGVAWGNPVVSGYKQREYSFNADLIYDPPPFLPTTGETKVISWEEIQ